MKIKKIISLVESLNIDELKLLISYLNENFTEKVEFDDYPLELQKLINEEDVEEIEYYLCHHPEIKISEDFLFMRDKNSINGKTLAHQIASNCPEIIDWHSIKNKNIFKLQMDNGVTVAHYLACLNGNNEYLFDKDILTLKTKVGENSVAHELAFYHPTWTTDDPEILNMKNLLGKTVKDILIQRGKIKDPNFVKIKF